MPDRPHPSVALKTRALEAAGWHVVNLGLHNALQGRSAGGAMPPPRQPSLPAAAHDQPTGNFDGAEPVGAAEIREALQGPAALGRMKRLLRDMLPRQLVTSATARTR
jgi:hypothetical protein